MANVWRRCPSRRLGAANLYNKAVGENAATIANEFWEAPSGETVDLSASLAGASVVSGAAARNRGLAASVAGVSGVSGDVSGGKFVVSKQIAAGEDDGRRYTGTDGFANDGADGYVGYSLSTAYDNCHWFLRFTGVTIGGTISTSYIRIYGVAGMKDSPELEVYGVDEDNPDAPTNAAEFDADPLTAAVVDWDGQWTAETWNQSPSLNAIFQELVDSYTIDNKAVMIQIRNAVSGATAKYNRGQFREGDSALAATLYIEYTSEKIVSLAGASDGVGAATATIQKTVSIIGTADGVATAGASIRRVRPLDGTVLGAALASANMRYLAALNGVADGAAGVGAVTLIMRGLAGNAAGVTGVGAALARLYALAGVSTGVGFSGSVLTLWMPLGGSLAGGATVGGATLIARGLAASIASGTTTAANLAKLYALFGGCTSEAAATADLLVQPPSGIEVWLAVSLEGSTETAANLVRLYALAGGSTGVGLTEAELTVLEGVKVWLQATLGGSATLSVALDRYLAAAGISVGSSATTSDIVRSRGLLGTIYGKAVSGGSLGVTYLKWLMVPVIGQAWCGASLCILYEAVYLGGTLESTVILIGNIEAESSLDGKVEMELAMAGDWTPSEEW